MIKQYFSFLIILFMITHLNAQTVNSPVIDIKSHSTLNIDKIEKSSESTIFFMSLKNELHEGYFCVNKDVFISIPGKSIKFEMLKSVGIENCPDMHKFTSPGQVINFKLYFPAISDTIKNLDLVENCTDNCFYIRGIHLDNEFNNEIHNFDIGVNYYRKDMISHALPYFMEIVNKSKFIDKKHFAYSMYIIPIIQEKNGLVDEAKKSFDKLLNSKITNKEYFINKIREIPFFKDK